MSRKLFEDKTIMPERQWIREPLWGHTTQREVLAATQSPIAYSSLEIKERIGSDSSNGKVYLALTNGRKFALKVFDPNEESATEVDIATRLGEMAKTNQDLPFPMTFGAGTVPEKDLRAFGLKPGAQYIVSELAVADLAQMFAEARKAKDHLATWSKENMPTLLPTGVMSLAKWKQEVAFHAYCCLRKLHEVGYAHLDPHQGNFMVLDSGKIVIHDFGTTKPKMAEIIEADFSWFATHFEKWGIPRSISK